MDSPLGGFGGRPDAWSFNLDRIAMVYQTGEDRSDNYFFGFLGDGTVVSRCLHGAHAEITADHKPPRCHWRRPPGGVGIAFFEGCSFVHEGSPGHPLGEEVDR